MMAINIDTRASGQKQGPKKQRKTRENVDFVLPMSSSFLDMATTSVTSSLTSVATRGATSSATVPISQTAIQQSFDSTPFWLGMLHSHHGSRKHNCS